MPGGKHFRRENKEYTITYHATSEGAIYEESADGDPGIADMFTGELGEPDYLLDEREALSIRRLETSWIRAHRYSQRTRFHPYDNDIHDSNETGSHLKHYHFRRGERQYDLSVQVSEYGGDEIEKQSGTDYAEMGREISSHLEGLRTFGTWIIGAHKAAKELGMQMTCTDGGRVEPTDANHEV